jgi:nicotinamidase-related amidase
VKRLGPASANTWQVADTHADLVRRPVPSRPGSVAALPKPITIDLGRTGMVVIDTQNNFCHRDGWLAAIGAGVIPARRPIAPLAALLPRPRAAGVPVIWVKWGNPTGPVEPVAGIAACLRADRTGPGTGRSAGPHRHAGAAGRQRSAAIVKALVPPDGDIHVAKHRMSGFWTRHSTPFAVTCGWTTCCSTA